MNFSDILKQIMDEHGITQQHLADKSGIHRVTISKYWNGKPARDDAKLKIAKGLSEITGFGFGVFLAMFLSVEED